MFSSVKVLIAPMRFYPLICEHPLRFRRAIPLIYAAYVWPAPNFAAVETRKFTRVPYKLKGTPPLSVYGYERTFFMAF